MVVRPPHDRYLLPLAAFSRARSGASVRSAMIGERSFCRVPCVRNALYAARHFEVDTHTYDICARSGAVRRARRACAMIVLFYIVLYILFCITIYILLYILLYYFYILFYTVLRTSFSCILYYTMSYVCYDVIV